MLSLEMNKEEDVGENEKEKGDLDHIGIEQAIQNFGNSLETFFTSYSEKLQKIKNEETELKQTLLARIHNATIVGQKLEENITAITKTLTQISVTLGTTPPAGPPQSICTTTNPN